MEGYNTFETEYHKTDMIHHANTNNAEDFGDVKSISALWTKDAHESIITGYINPRIDISQANLDIMVHTTRAADQSPYHTHTALHGIGNYIKGLKFFYWVAQEVRKGTANSKACEAAYNQIPHDSNDTIEEVKNLTLRMLNNGSSGNGDRFYRVMGFALHCIGDTFAHRAYVYELAGFNKADFHDYAGFLNEYNTGKLEYRNIKNYTDANLSTYEDNTGIGANRYKNAKLKCLQFYNAAKDKTGYTKDFFSNFTYTLTLDRYDKYATSY